MQNSTTLKTDQKMNLVLSDFFSDFTARNASDRVKLKEKLNAKEKDQFKDLLTKDSNVETLDDLYHRHKDFYRVYPSPQIP